jgi:GMP synthase-like glutamine amidotransferase
MKKILYVNAMLDRESGEAYKQGLHLALNSSRLAGSVEIVALDLMYGERVPARLMGVYQREVGADAVVFSGSEKNTTDRDDPWLRDYASGLEDLLGLRGRNVDDWGGPPCPVLGICFGHQALACYFGGETSRFTSRVGFVDSLLMHQGHRNPVLRRLLSAQPAIDDRLSLAASHADQVVRLPPGFHLLLTSDYCEVQAMAHDQWPIMSFQTHPEVTELLKTSSTDKADWESYSRADFERQHGPALLQAWFEWALT